MEIEIFWTEKAKSSFKENLIYLKQEWSKNEIQNFILEVDKKIKLLASNPLLGRFDEKLKCSKLLIVKQITLFYIYENQEINLLIFWNNYRKTIKNL